MNTITIQPEMLEKFAEKVDEYAKNPEKRLQEAINNKNTNMVRSILKLDLNDKKVSFEELVIKTLYIVQIHPNQAKEIFEKFELSKLHKDLETDKNLWNEDYFLTQQSYFTLNFAFERLIHLAHVKQELMSKRINSQDNSPVVVGRSKHQTTTFDKTFNEEARQPLDKILGFIKGNAIPIAITIVAIALVVLFVLL